MSNPQTHKTMRKKRSGMSTSLRPRTPTKHNTAQNELCAPELYAIAKRGRAALEAQAFLRGTIRARLRRMYPDLSPREITLKYFQEVARNG